MLPALFCKKKKKKKKSQKKKKKKKSKIHQLNKKLNKQFYTFKETEKN